VLIHQLTDSECKEVLARTNLGRLACAREDQPYIVPIFFSFDAENHCLHSFSTVGQKIEWMRKNPKVSVEVEEISDQFHWTTVVVTGRYFEVTDPDRVQAAHRAQTLFEERPQWWLPAAANLASGELRGEHVIYGIRVNALSGRRTTRPPSPSATR
jgi:nitroimidazol reductase NimA-like FMN-containing flavoprotein (pyridoxamine 5'-phosphate oxidase superfamily)